MAILDTVHWDTVTRQMWEVLEHLGRQPIMGEFYLAGGTALALRLGHRRSVDLDFFTENRMRQGVRRSLLHALDSYPLETLEDFDGNLLLTVQGLQVGFFSYSSPLLDPVDQVAGVALASVTDIGLMKLDALIGRGSRKDFYDLYHILPLVSIERLFEMSRAKYPQARDFPLMAAESLVLFENADRDVQPALLVETPWEDVRAYFLRLGGELGQAWLEE